MSVLLFHSAFIFGSPIKSSFSGVWYFDLVAFSPLRLPFLGAEAVHLFFLLSGFTLPMVANKLPVTSFRYFASRFVRLYLPVWGALLIFAALCTVGITSTQLATNSPTASDWFHDSILVLGAGKTIGALWSLTWEVIFSLTLFIWVKLVRFGKFWLQVTVCIAMVYLGDALNVGVLQYVPMFVIGVAMHHNKETLEGVFNRVQNYLPGWLALPSIAFLLCAPYYLAPLFGDKVDSVDLLKNSFYVFEFAGLILIISYAIWSSKFKSFLQSRVVYRLGVWSYSLYLVHQIVILLVEPLGLPAAITFLLDVSLAIPAAWLFHVLLEKRVHNLARRISGIAA